MFGLRTLELREPKPSQQASEYELLDLLNCFQEIVTTHCWSLSDSELWFLPNVPEDIYALEQMGRELQAVWLVGDQLLKLAGFVTVSNWGAFLGYRLSEAGFQYHEPPRSEGEIHSIQHPLAIIEIQAVDGSYFEVYFKLPEVYAGIGKKFLTAECGSR